MLLTRTRRGFLRATLLCLAVAVSLGIAEVGVRMLMPQDLGFLAPWYESHPVYRFRHYPNMDAMRTWGNTYRLRTNSHGVRADHDEAYVSPSETRIVVHGDSLTFGVGVDSEDTFVGRTQQLLRRSIDGVDLLNLGVSGHGPDQEYLLFLEEGRKYSPRICVIAVCLRNDLDDLTRPRTAFRLQGEELIYIPYEPPLLKKLAESRMYRWLASRSHLLVLTRYVLFDARIDAREREIRTAQPPPVALALAVYRDFIAAVRDEGAVPVIVLLPSKDQMALRRGVPTEPPTASSIILRDALIQFCAANGVLCVDAVEGVARPDVPFDSLFIPGDDHFSAAGYRLIAEFLEKPLRDLLASLDIQ
jgi:lysophospholipase L1-like esterase